jgi:hypothetical protein
MPTVFIWQNNMLPGGREARHATKNKVLHWPGHASLLIDDQWTDQYTSMSASYVSWWPGAQRDLSFGEKLESKTAGMKVATASQKNHFRSDMIGEGYLPDNIVRIAASEAQQQAMKAKWADIRGKPNASYRALYKNCSTIVARVLRAGKFKTGKLSFWTDHSLVWNPNKILTFALAAGGVQMTWTQFYPELEAVGVNYSSWGGTRKSRDSRYSSTGVECVNNYPT